MSQNQNKSEELPFGAGYGPDFAIDLTVTPLPPKTTSPPAQDVPAPDYFDFSAFQAGQNDLPLNAANNSETLADEFGNQNYHIAFEDVYDGFAWPQDISAVADTDVWSPIDVRKLTLASSYYWSPDYLLS